MSSTNPDKPNEDQVHRPESDELETQQLEDAIAMEGQSPDDDEGATQIEAPSSSSNLKMHIKRGVQIAFTLFAIVWVTNKIEFEKVGEIMKSARFGWLIPAYIFYNGSKVLSAFRLKTFYRAIEVRLEWWFNLKLYYFGMFCNLFLPGGIGGDGYKIYWLRKRGYSRTRPLITTTLMDRISGMVCLSFYAGILFPMSSFGGLSGWLSTASTLATIAIIPAFYFILKKLFSGYLRVFGNTTGKSLGVQLLQVICALCIVLALNGQGVIIDFLTLFLISSVVSVLPISIGGIGLREFTFVYGFELIGQDANIAVSFSVLFFVIHALSSLMGVVFMKGLQKKD